MNQSVQTSYMKNINSTLTHANREKQYFYDVVLYDGTDRLSLLDYRTSSIVGVWNNTSGKTAYITDAVFNYGGDFNPNPVRTYNCPNDAWTTTLGAYDGSSFISPSFDVNWNRDQVKGMRRGANWNGYTVFDWTYDFSNAPIKVENGNSFGHLIAGNFSINYSLSPVCNIQGYYLNS